MNQKSIERELERKNTNLSKIKNFEVVVWTMATTYPLVSTSTAIALVKAEIQLKLVRLGTHFR